MICRKCGHRKTLRAKVHVNAWDIKGNGTIMAIHDKNGLSIKIKGNELYFQRHEISNFA